MIMNQDKVSNNFIEGRIQSTPVNSIYYEGTADKAAYHADLTQGYEEEDVNASIYDADIPFYEAN